MSRNGSGTYSLPAGNPVVTGTTISSSWANNTLSDIATALTGSVASDGQTPMTGNLDLNSNKIVNVTDPTLAQDAATKNYSDTTYLAKASNLSDVANTTTARTNISAAKSGANSDITSLTGLTTPLSQAQGGTGTTTGYYGFKNRIINGAMVIAQRGTSAVTTDASFPVDRFQLQVVNANLSLIQSSTAPAGFNYSIEATVTSTTSTNANDRSRLFQCVEGLNVADLNWGTANAKTITVSFWARSTVTGTYSGNVGNSAGDRSYVFTYALTANTWTYVTITIAGDTSGTWLTTNGIGLILNPITFNCGSNFQGTAGSWLASGARGTAGSTYLATSNSGAVFNITGVQLEVGSTATSFDYRPYGTELALCQRYFQGTTNANDGNNYYYGSGSNLTSSIAYVTYPFLVSMRTSPTLTSSGTFQIRGGGNAETVTSVSLVTSTTTTAGVNFTVGGATLTVGYGVVARSGGSTVNTLFFSAEL